MLSAHVDGVVRLWDASHGEVEAGEAFEIDVAGVVRAFTPNVPVDVIALSMAGMTGELVVGTYTGEVCVWRHGVRDRDDEFAEGMGDMSLEMRPNKILYNTRQLHFNVNEGFLPLCMVNPQRGAPSIVKMSEVGFVAIGYDSGYICVVDLRGPAVIFLEDLSNVQSEKDKKSGRKTQGQSVEVATVMEFGIMKLEGNDYSSLVLITGTNKGRLISHALVPTKTGGYAVRFDTSTSYASEGGVVAVMPIRAKDGASVIATPLALAGLRDGIMTEAATIVVQERGIRILGGVTNKLEKAEIKDRTIVRAELVARESGIALVVVADNRRITAWSIPEIQRIGEVVLPNYVVAKRFLHAHYEANHRLHETVVTPDGDLFCWTDKRECSLFTLWGRGLKMSDIPADALYDAVKSVPARPTISNLQWIMGTQYIRVDDLNLLSIPHSSTLLTR